ncbi:MAG: hypothetical protein ACP5UZ_07450 [Thermoplasmata archaeon]
MVLKTEMKIKIDKSEKRRLPRKFEFPWGKGMISEEASIRCSISGQGFKDTWEPTIQLLQFDDGEIAVRFCVYGNGRLRRMPLILNNEQATRLASEIRSNRKLKLIVGKLLK